MQSFLWQWKALHYKKCKDYDVVMHVIQSSYWNDTMILSIAFAMIDGSLKKGGDVSIHVICIPAMS